MTASIVVSTHADDLVAVKTGPDSGALEQEAVQLARIDHPGVVQLVAYEDGPPARLLTRFVGPDGWASRPAGSDDDTVRGLARIAGTIADLHEVGISHGSIHADHIVLASDGRPVLCSLGQAGEADASGLATDHTALAKLFRSTACGRHRGAVHLVADGLRSGRLTARSATVQLNAITASMPGSPHRFSRLHLQRGRVTTLLALVATGAVLVAVGVQVISNTADTHPRATADSVAAATGAEPITTEPGESTALGSATGQVVEHNGRRYAIGEPGDVVIVADWNCRGVTTPAVLRPTTGVVGLFAAWPDAGASASPNRVETIEGAESLTIDDTGACTRLRVHTATTSHLILAEAS